MTKLPAIRKPGIPMDGYMTLRRKVAHVLLVGKRKIEQAKVQAYWQAG